MGKVEAGRFFLREQPITLQETLDPETKDFVRVIQFMREEVEEKGEISRLSMQALARVTIKIFSRKP